MLVYITRDSLPVIGLLWNPRLLPFVYLMRYLLMMIGASRSSAGWSTPSAARPAQQMTVYEGASRRG